MRIPAPVSFFLGVILLWPQASQGQTFDPSMPVAREFVPFVLRPQDPSDVAFVPDWVPRDAAIDPESASVEIPVPALSTQPSVSRFALSVVFEDNGDGGPSVEWRRADGSIVTISEGLGEALDDRVLGLNANTLLLPQELTRNGGSVIVTYFGRFPALTGVTLRPARESLVALIGARTDPALVDESLRVMLADEVDGRRSPPLTGDVRNGGVVEAELAAAIEEIPGELEFVVPVEGKILGVMLRMELLGLDLEGTVEVTLNEARIGSLNMASFALDDPAVTEDESGRLVVAGWRTGTLFLPAKYWQNGENRLVLRVIRTADDPGKPVYLRNSGLHLRFGPPAQASVYPDEDPALPASGELLPAPEDELVMPREEKEKGELEIDFLEPQVLIEPPSEPSLPVVITTRP